MVGLYFKTERVRVTGPDCNYTAIPTHFSCLPPVSSANKLPDIRYHRFIFTGAPAPLVMDYDQNDQN